MSDFEKDFAKEIESLTFEEAFAQCKKCLSSLENTDLPLADAVHIFSRGISLKKHCQSLLQKAKETIEIISTDDTQAG